MEQHTEQSNTQQNAENNHSKESNSLIEREEIPGTPFTLIRQNEKWFIVMGDYRVTEPTLNRETQMIKLENERYLLTMHIAIVVNRKMQEADKMAQMENQAYETESL